MTLASQKLSEEQDYARAKWYVVATKTREEEKARINLERQGYSVFLPKLSLKKRRKGHWQVVTESLFPSYLFVALELGEDDPAPIRSTVGCIGLVRFAHVYTPVPGELIESLQAIESATNDVEAPFKPGDKIHLVSGPFAGIEAVFEMARAGDRAQVLVNILGKVQGVNVEIDGICK
jgi:transcriptional antiterminator RfaH